MQNDKIKEYWEGEAGIYSEGIKAELKSETAENWKNLILELLQRRHWNFGMQGSPSLS